MEKGYDYIIAGGGCAGLSLAWHICHTPSLRKKRILILDRAEKNQNDRTWCFWEKEAGPFEEIVKHSWDNVWFHTPGFSKCLDMNPYAYKMIVSSDFYRHVKTFLSQCPNVEWLQAEILNLESGDYSAKVETSVGKFEAEWVFSSLLPPQEKKKEHHYLLQHFKGWVVKSRTPVFDPGQPVLMDFRIGQGGDCRFMYVLPASETEALVEFTVFSEALLPDNEYDQALTDYLVQFLQLKEYEVIHHEFGIIPMFSERFPPMPGRRIVPIGTAGNQTKASTGYTFTRIQKHSQRICLRLAEDDDLAHDLENESRFNLYDSILLHVLARHKVPGRVVFQQLFRHNSPQTVFRFLDEETQFWEEIRILNSVPILKFLGPAFIEGWKLILRSWK